MKINKKRPGLVHLKKTNNSPAWTEDAHSQCHCSGTVNKHSELKMQQFNLKRHNLNVFVCQVQTLAKKANNSPAWTDTCSSGSEHHCTSSSESKMQPFNLKRPILLVFVILKNFYVKLEQPWLAHTSIYLQIDSNLSRLKEKVSATKIHPNAIHQSCLGQPFGCTQWAPIRQSKCNYHNSIIIPDKTEECCSFQPSIMYYI